MKKRYPNQDTNKQLIWNFRDISHTMRRISEGKGSQKRILMLLQETEGMTQKELTEQLGVQPGSVSEVLSKLEASGLILRTSSNIDRRTMDIQLTEAGEALAKQAYIHREERHKQMFAILSLEEKNTLLQLLEKVNADWDEKYAKREEK